MWKYKYLKAQPDITNSDGDNRQNILMHYYFHSFTMYQTVASENIIQIS